MFPSMMPEKPVQQLRRIDLTIINSAIKANADAAAAYAAGDPNAEEAGMRACHIFDAIKQRVPGFNLKAFCTAFGVPMMAGAPRQEPS